MSRSLVFLTGRKRLLGTLMPNVHSRMASDGSDHDKNYRDLPIAPLKFLIAAPAAFSNCITLVPFSSVCRMC